MRRREHQSLELWKDRVIDGRTISFRHLRSFDMPFIKPAFKNLLPLCATIRVVFDCHVITEKHTTNLAEGSSYWRDSGDRCRVFNQLRYDMSLKLPGIIEQLPLGRIAIYAGKSNNYMVWRPTESATGVPHYQIYFDLYKVAEQDDLLILYVQSAYLKNEPIAVQRERKLAFGRICAELLGRVSKPKKGRLKVKSNKVVA